MIAQETSTFSDAYVKGFPVTLQFLRSLGIDPDRAEEIAQAAWAKGWEKRRSLREQERLIPWANTIALNLFRSWFRRRVKTRAQAVGLIQ